MSEEDADLVIVDWKDLNSPEKSDFLADALERAFGSTGFGLIVIRNVPGFVQAKQAFLPQAYQLVNLPKDYLEDNLTNPEALYNAGWSHGKEKLGDKPDTAKGSFYYNPVTDMPGTDQERRDYPASYPQNKWPTDKLPNFEASAKQIGIILKDAVTLLSKHIDRLAQSKIKDYPENLLYNAMKDTEKVKCRLLYYFPLDDDDNSNNNTEDSWIGWHNDSGFLTALAGDMYVDHSTGQLIDCPDPDAGLYVVDRNDQMRHIHIPNNCMAIQMGECTQIVTGGAVTATPHCVRGTNKGTNVARISLPCFVDTPPTFPLKVPPSCTCEEVFAAGSKNRRVPPLDQRWKENGMAFGDFLQTTFAMYYDWNKPN